MSKKIYIIDGYNFLYRVFYAIPPFSLKDGTPVNAVFGMAKILLALHREDRPDYLIFTLDSRSKARMELYPEYKGTRDRMPDNLKIQESIIMEMLRIMGIKHLKVDGYEADDIIGTLVTKLAPLSSEGEGLGVRQDNYNIFILSGDKDLYQFIDGNVAIYDTMKHKVYHTAEAREKFSVDPKHIVDYLAICGDSSDNIPGIPGFGPKKAESLINEYGTLEQIYENIEKITGKTRETLETNREIAFVSKQLATIDTAVPLDSFSLREHIFAERTFLTPEVIAFFTQYDFRSLLPKEHVQTKDFSSLKLKQIPILGESEIETCLKCLKKTRKISLATYGERFALSGGTLYFGGDETYVFETNMVDLKPFFKEMLSSFSDFISESGEVVSESPSATADGGVPQPVEKKNQKNSYQIIGYDLKKDLERIEAYLEGTSSEIKTGQMGLF
ncbi:MAG: 5'-3' exonuclease H3TH domain-containing protein [Candidatus Gracilibacteria bacterium]|nr:5'-3' exonuclease H3TH domain-containing protein [Candidatus Gracilibacteria bacterium]